MATDPFHNPRAAPGPTYVPQYKLAGQAKADELDREAKRGGGRQPRGGRGRRVGPDHGVPGRGAVPGRHRRTFKLPTVRYVLIVVGAVLLVLATVLILIQPGLPA
jgi:hypothetical protein